MKVLHIFDHSLPYVTDYSLRSRYIVKLQRGIGIKPLAITSPKHIITSNPMELIEGVFHYRSFFPDDKASLWNRCPLWKEKPVVSALSQVIQQVVVHQKIDLIHAHSPYTNGFAAMEVCRKWKIPLLYEIRSLRENLSGDYGIRKTGSLYSILDQNLEIFVCRQAGAVIIGEDHIEQLIQQGVSEENIYGVPYEVGIPMLEPLAAEEYLTPNGNQSSNPLVDFISSFYHYEGVDYLLRVFFKIWEKAPSGKYLLASDRNDAERIKMPSHAQSASGHIIYIGQVKPKDIKRSYSLINIMVYPNLWGDSADNTAPPSAPLEALTLDKDSAVTDASNWPELMGNKQTGFYFKIGQISDLTGKCLKLAMNKQLQQKIGKDICRRVDHDRVWLKILGQYLKAYKQLLNQ